MSKSFVTSSRYLFGKEVLEKMQVEGSDAESFILCDRVRCKERSTPGFGFIRSGRVMKIFDVQCS